MENTYKVGDTVTVSFLGSKHVSEIIHVRNHPQDENKIIYTAQSENGIIIPYVGVNGSEKFANIFTEDFDIKTITHGKVRKSKRKVESNNEEIS